MDLSKLDRNEQLALYGAIAVFIAGLVSSWGGLLMLAILAAIGMAIVVLLPQLSKATTLPGSKGSFMAALGFVAAGATLITLLQWIGFIGAFGINSIALIVAVGGSLVMAWAGWQALQAEGGTWRFGTEASQSAAPAAATATEPEARADADADAHEAHEAHEAHTANDAPADAPATTADAAAPEDRRTTEA